MVGPVHSTSKNIYEPYTAPELGAAKVKVKLPFLEPVSSLVTF